MSKKLLIVVALVALLGLQFADCTSAMTQDQQSMQCCGSMPCDPSNQSHDCCKGMVSPQSPSVLPVAHVTLHAPVMVVSGVLASPRQRHTPKFLAWISRRPSIHLQSCTLFILPS